MLSRALVGLNSGELQAFAGVDFLCDGKRRGTWFNPASACADINFHQTFKAVSMPDGCGCKFIDVTRIIDADQYPCASGEPGQAINLVWIHDLVRQHYVADTAGDHNLRFSHLLAADATGATMLDLVARNIDRFVGLAMRAQAYPGTGEPVA
jgi:hypothetical protein